MFKRHSREINSRISRTASDDSSTKMIRYVFLSKANKETYYDLCNKFTLDDFLDYKETIDIYEDMQTAKTMDEIEEAERQKQNNK